MPRATNSKSSKTKLTEDQANWGLVFKDCINAMYDKQEEPQACPPIPVQYYCWYPKNSDEIVSTLSQGRLTEWNLT